MSHRSRACVTVGCVGTSLALLFALASTATAAKRITGKLSKRGYTVIALASSGQGSSVRATRGKFRIRPPAKRVTLHLRAPEGTYAGPVVVGRKGKKAILGVKAGAELGKVKVRAGKGYAKVKRELPKGSLDAKRSARARKGVPIGAGNFGRVSSANAKGGVPGDGDLDGVADPLDIDDDGDLILDDLDRSSATLGAQAAQDGGSILDFFSGMELALEQTTNANAPGATGDEQQIESALAGSGALLFQVPPGESVELDCAGTPNPAPPPPLLGGLSYCTSPSTGNVGGSGGPAFPDCCDADGDGWGSLTPPGGPFFLAHGATTSQMRTGQVLIGRSSSGDPPVETTYQSTVQFVAATVPALVSYGDTAGNSGMVAYPVSPGGPGTMGNELAVDDVAGDVVVTLTFWRPQRRPIPENGETGDWYDIGGLTHKTIVQYLGVPPGGTQVQQPCPQSSYSGAAPAPSEQGGPGVVDPTAEDLPANPLNTVTYTVNLTQCIAALGASWDPGEEASIFFSTVRAKAGQIAGATRQTVWFERLP